MEEKEEVMEEKEEEEEEVWERETGGNKERGVDVGKRKKGK